MPQKTRACGQYGPPWPLFVASKVHATPVWPEL